MSGETWALVDITPDDSPDEVFVLRIRTDLETSAHRKTLPHLLTITWAYPGGGLKMPDQVTSAAMEAFEEALHALADGTAATLLSHVLTGDGERTWHFYARDVEEFSRDFHAAVRDQPVFPIRISAGGDPDWENYASYLAYTKAEA